MMFGMLNVSLYFCKLISHVSNGLESFTVLRIDVLCLFTVMFVYWESQLAGLEAVLGGLKNAVLTVKPSICLFVQDQVNFLGHKDGSGKRLPNGAKIKAIQEFPIPETKTQLCAFLGTNGYYARYVNDYVRIAVPLTDALKGKVKKKKISWTEDCQVAFIALKASLMSSPVLYSPDYSAEFIVQSDASLFGAGNVLSPIRNGEELPIVYFNEKFLKTEQNYSTRERELAAIVYEMRKLSHYLDGRKFFLQTDHHPLTYLNMMLGVNARLIRWALGLQLYNFTVTHRAGRLNGNAGGLSSLTTYDPGGYDTSEPFFST